MKTKTWLSLLRAVPIVLLLLTIGCKSTSSFDTQEREIFTGTLVRISSNSEPSCVFLDTTSYEAATGLGFDILGGLITQVSSFIAAALTEAGTTQTTIGETASYNFKASANHPPLCVQIVRGDFYRSEPKNASVLPGWASNAKIATTQWTKFNQLQIHMAAPPEFVFEGFFYPEKKNVFVLTPTYYAYRTSLLNDGLTFDGSRGISIALDIYSPTAASGKPQGSIVLPMGTIRRGQLKCYGELKDNGCTYSLKKTDDTIFNAVQTSIPFIMNLPKENDTPLYARSVITETRDGNAFFDFIGKLYSPTQTSIVAAAKTKAELALSETARNSANIDSETVVVTAQTAYVDSISAASKALNICANADPSHSDFISYAADARKAQLTANLKAHTMGKRDVYSNELIVPLNSSQGTKAICSDALNVQIP